MKRHHLRTLQALFAHPISHGIRVSQAEALLRALGAEVSEIEDRRLRVRMPAGQESWIRIGCGVRQPELDADGVMRLRHLLEQAGVSPTHPEADEASPRGDQSIRLVLHLDHHITDVYRLEGEEVEHAQLRPHGVWGSGQNLTHRHDRDVAGQRAPRDNDYLARISAAISDADAVLLLGHGTGESDMRRVLVHYLETHRRDLLEKVVGIETIDASGLSSDGLLAIAKEHFGNLPHRRTRLIPGQEVVSG
ncbi:MAG: hypothetical protein VKI83_10275 [Synechococcaceae cyanobacterium]|nr:hypothetical protein [Synechococcaceae cyanobacterium]